MSNILKLVVRVNILIVVSYLLSLVLYTHPLHLHLRSYGVLLYELITGGSVPYATLSNSDVKSKVAEGYRLPLPQGCPEELYKLMLRCWAQRPTDRPHFSEVLKDGVEPLQAKAER